MRNKVVASLFVAAIASASAPALADVGDGFFRIGDECFFVVDGTWFQMPCPREVNGGN